MFCMCDSFCCDLHTWIIGQRSDVISVSFLALLYKCWEQLDRYYSIQQNWYCFLFYDFSMKIHTKENRYPQNCGRLKQFQAAERRMNVNANEKLIRTKKTVYSNFDSHWKTSVKIIKRWMQNHRYQNAEFSIMVTSTVSYFEDSAS